jgi:hypothetical protein
MHTGHAVYPNGIVSCAVPEVCRAKGSCTLAELLKATLCNDDAIDHCPDTLAVAFDNMYEEHGHDWWHEFEIRELNAEVDLSSCSRQAPPGRDASYNLRAAIIHRHSGQARRTQTSGHYIAQFKRGDSWYVADDAFVNKCEPLRSMQDDVLFPYVLFLTKSDVDIADLEPMDCNIEMDPFVLQVLERAPHLELDAELLFSLEEVQQNHLSDGIERLLAGDLFDDLQRDQCLVLRKCSAILRDVLVDSDSDADPLLVNHDMDDADLPAGDGPARADAVADSMLVNDDMDDADLPAGDGPTKADAPARPAAKARVISANQRTMDCYIRKRPSASPALRLNSGRQHNRGAPQRDQSPRQQDRGARQQDRSARDQSARQQG